MFTYSLVSTAISDDRRTLRQGMRLLAEIAHKYDIPITWAVSADFARTVAADLTAWHEAHGDEPLLIVDAAPIWETDKDLTDSRQLAEHIVTMREKLPDHITSEWGKIQRAMPWANPGIVGADWKHSVLLYGLEQVEFKGLWGYQWGKGEDQGCPFGFFYPAVDKHNFGGNDTSRVVGIPHASIDLTQTRAVGLGEPVDDGLRSGIFNNTAKQTFDAYRHNVQWNRWLAFVQHVRAEDILGLGTEGIEQLEEYFAYIRQQDQTQILRLTETVENYRKLCNETPSTLLLTSTGAEGNGKTESSLLYYDAECQLVFQRGEMEPSEMQNYISPPADSRYAVEFTLPKIEQFRPSRTRDKLSFHFSLESLKAMPYGFAIWGNHLGLTLATSNAQSVTWIGDQVLFIRAALKTGKNEIEVVLTI